MEVLFEIFIAIATPIIIYGIYIIVSGKGRTIEMQAKIAEKKMRDAKKMAERKKGWKKFFDGELPEVYR